MCHGQRAFYTNNKEDRHTSIYWSCYRLGRAPKIERLGLIHCGMSFLTPNHQHRGMTTTHYMGECGYHGRWHLGTRRGPFG